ncbi:hypothetical protein HD554DRAFT_2038110 [Boletus coccyginus]|nr:hypothetical protein HD554DRAFT_2038110 [Boletus coccyginus]
MSRALFKSMLHDKLNLFHVVCGRGTVNGAAVKVCLIMLGAASSSSTSTAGPRILRWRIPVYEPNTNSSRGGVYMQGLDAAAPPSSGTSNQACNAPAQLPVLVPSLPPPAPTWSSSSFASEVRLPIFSPTQVVLPRSQRGTADFAGVQLLHVTRRNPLDIYKPSANTRAIDSTPPLIRTWLPRTPDSSRPDSVAASSLGHIDAGVLWDDARPLASPSSGFL